jgi:hypothetical protein
MLRCVWISPFVPCRGLKATHYTQEVQVDPLWTVQQARQPAPSYRRPPSATALQALAFHKEQPETATERSDCIAVLEAGALSSLFVGPRVLDFGKISPAMAAMQHFVVTNPLPAAIHVVLDMVELPDLSCKGPVGQVVPPGATAKWPLQLRAHDMGPVRSKLEFCINGCHFHVSSGVLSMTTLVAQEGCTNAILLKRF